MRCSRCPSVRFHFFTVAHGNTNRPRTIHAPVGHPKLATQSRPRAWARGRLVEPSRAALASKTFRRGMRCLRARSGKSALASPLWQARSGKPALASPHRQDGVSPAGRQSVGSVFSTFPTLARPCRWAARRAGLPGDCLPGRPTPRPAPTVRHCRRWPSHRWCAPARWRSGPDSWVRQPLDPCPRGPRRQRAGRQPRRRSGCD